VLGELYGGANETRFTRDFEQVPAWATGTGPAPGTVEASNFSDTRLLTLKSRTSAAYKGVYALLMDDGCKDWLENKDLSYSRFLDYKVDIHHIFPQRWCMNNGIEHHRQESIVNKTALSRRTNQKIGGKSPKIYVPRIMAEAGLNDSEFDEIVKGHYVDASALRSGDFDTFFENRFEALSDLIAKAMGKPVLKNPVRFDQSEFEDVEDDDEDDVFDDENLVAS
jgi:hypothetical protein